MISLIIKAHSIDNPSFTAICNNQSILKSLKKPNPVMKLAHQKEAEANLLLMFEAYVNKEHW